jgi:hypothetical protein
LLCHRIGGEQRRQIDHRRRIDWRTPDRRSSAAIGSHHRLRSTRDAAMRSLYRPVVQFVVADRLQIIAGPALRRVAIPSDHQPRGGDGWLPDITLARVRQSPCQASGDRHRTDVAVGDLRRILTTPCIGLSSRILAHGIAEDRAQQADGTPGDTMAAAYDQPELVSVRIGSTFGDRLVIAR